MANPANMLAVALEARHNVQLLQSQVQSSMSNVVSRLDSVSAEQREAAKTMTQVLEEVHGLRASSKGLDRLSIAIESNSREFAAWRDKHEGQNQIVADRVTGARGALWVVTFVLAVVATLAGTYVSAEFANIRREADLQEAVARRESTAAEERSKAAMDQLRSAVNENQKKLDEIRNMRGLK